MTSSDLSQQVRTHFGERITQHNEFRGEHTLYTTLSDLKSVLLYCRDELKMDYLVDLSSLDHLGTSGKRFELVYELSGFSHNQHLRIKASVAENENAPSAIEIWASADWHEREVYDMMGIHFDGHPNLKRILMWEGFPHFPLRKDYPLAGIPTDLPEVAFTGVAPLADGPFVTSAGACDTVTREPRAKTF
jgi:NADH-quinone oxidoreductase subunit C